MKKNIYMMYICMCVCYVVWTFSLPPSSFQSSAASCGTRLSRFNKIQGNSLSGLFKPLQRVGHSLSQRWLHDTSFCHVLSTFPNFAGASGHVCRRKHRFETCWTESCKIPHYWALDLTMSITATTSMSLPATETWRHCEEMEVSQYQHIAMTC